MKKIIAGLIIGLISLTALDANAQGCDNFHKRKCEGSENPLMKYNSQSKSGLFILGHTSDLTFVAHAKHDYRITLCQDKKVEEPIKFKVLDGRTKEVLFDNETAMLDTPAEEDNGDQSLPQHFEFSSSVTKKIIVRITAPGPPPEENKKGKREDPDPEDLFCVGVLLQNMPTPKLGF